MIFWLFAIPLFSLLRTFFVHIGDFNAWLAAPLERYAFFAYILVSALMIFMGVASRFFGYNPSPLRRLLGPESAFVWGEGKDEFERQEKVRHYTLLVLGVTFIFFMIVSINFATH
jgi:hypothetical protein